MTAQEFLALFESVVNNQIQQLIMTGNEVEVVPGTLFILAGGWLYKAAASDNPVYEKFMFVGDETQDNVSAIINDVFNFDFRTMQLHFTRMINRNPTQAYNMVKMFGFNYRFVNINSTTITVNGIDRTDSDILWLHMSPFFEWMQGLTIFQPLPDVDAEDSYSIRNQKSAINAIVLRNESIARRMLRKITHWSRTLASYIRNSGRVFDGMLVTVNGKDSDNIFKKLHNGIRRLLINMSNKRKVERVNTNNTSSEDSRTTQKVKNPSCDCLNN